MICLPASICAHLCFGDCCQNSLVDDELIVNALDTKGKQKQEVIDIDSDTEDSE